MKKIGILRGMETTFPEALIDRINSLNTEATAEFIQVGGIKMDELYAYDVILDRISQDIPFYRAMLKNASLSGVHVINNPFWWSADDKFFGYSLAKKLGVPVPKTVLLPHKDHPPDTNSNSMRNLIFPLNWQEIFDYIGFPAFMKPHSGGGWKDVYKVNDPGELFSSYGKTHTLCMTLQEEIDFTHYYRCYCIGKKYIRIMEYAPKQPHHLRYVQNPDPIPPALESEIKQHCLTLCNALGYDFNTLEFAVRDGIPYAIDFTNPSPDADLNSVGLENFTWVVETAAEFLIDRALNYETTLKNYNSGEFAEGKIVKRKTPPAKKK
ncbi:hypothetical protein IT568_10950 [bacterium]|nr:hypothetical protein [bacterium]